MTTMTGQHDVFDWPRFVRVICNDFAQVQKRLVIATLAMVGFGLIIYLTNMGMPGSEPQLYEGLFATALVAGGLLFTSTIFADLHHPLQRFQYLTLPCSNLERFLSRYLLTGPLFYLYVVAVYYVFDFLAAASAEALMNLRDDSFALSAEPVIDASLLYVLLHAGMLLGAIYFRSYALIKSSLAAVLLLLVTGFLQVMTVRLVYWEYFTGFFPHDGIVLPTRSLDSPLILLLLGFLLHLWVLYLAYCCLEDHEVQE